MATEPDRLLGEDVMTNETLAFAFELAVGAEPPADVETTRPPFLERLAEVNQDYREVVRLIPPAREPTLEFHPAAEGPFAGYAHPPDGRTLGGERRARADLHDFPRWVGAVPPQRCGRVTGDAEARRRRGARIVVEAHAGVVALLTENRERLDALANALLEHETLDEDDAYAAAGVTRAQTDPAGELAPAARFVT